MEELLSLSEKAIDSQRVVASPPCSAQPLISIPELARLLGTTIRHVRRLVTEKRVPHLKVGGLIRFDQSEIADWLEEQRVGICKPNRPSRRRL